jgi:predicted nucleic acid-binding protein
LEGPSLAGTSVCQPPPSYLVAAAVAGEADFLVTLDRNLLDLVGPPGVVIVRPGDFLSELRASNR